MSLKSSVRKIVPEFWLSLYHRVVAIVAMFLYGNPSRKMIVIGVTGTKGKSTTGNIIWKLLTDAGHKVGLTGTVNYRIGDTNELTTNKMTMPGRFELQKVLQKMVQAGCDIAIVETTSEGVKQWRHLGIHYDIGVFTNLSPEHLESHGGFENYKAAKLEFFEHIRRSPKKMIEGKEIEQVSVINMDNEHGADFLDIGDFKKVKVGADGSYEVAITEVQETLCNTIFKINDQEAVIPLLGTWNAMNTAVAMGVGMALGVELEGMIKSANELEQVPGRMEFIDEGQEFSLVVDYAYEPVSLELLYSFCRNLIGENNKLITLISSTGGGRDVGRRPKNGAIAAKLCDYLIVTDEDPYDDNPQEIIDQVAAGALKAGAEEGKNLWRVLDRTEGIKRAVELAQPGDVVLLTAKGAEQRMCVADGKKIIWDDRKSARDALKELKK